MTTNPSDKITAGLKARRDGYAPVRVPMLSGHEVLAVASDVSMIAVASAKAVEAFVEWQAKASADVAARYEALKALQPVERLRAIKSEIAAQVDGKRAELVEKLRHSMVEARAKRDAVRHQVEKFYSNRVSFLGLSGLGSDRRASMVKSFELGGPVALAYACEVASGTQDAEMAASILDAISYLPKDRRPAVDAMALAASIELPAFDAATNALKIADLAFAQMERIEAVVEKNAQGLESIAAGLAARTAADVAAFLMPDGSVKPEYMTAAQSKAAVIGRRAKFVPAADGSAFGTLSYE